MKSKNQEIKDSGFKIAFVVAIIFVCVASLFSLSSFQQIPTSKYKTINDSAFEVGDLIVIHGIYFNLNRCDFRNDSITNPADSLKPVAGFLKEHPNLTVEVGYHTDYVNPASSQNLTKCRAESCYTELLKLGIDSARLSFQGYGNTRPYVLEIDLILPSGKAVSKGRILTDKFLDSFQSNKGDYQFLRAMNRRTEIKIIGIDFKK